MKQTMILNLSQRPGRGGDDVLHVMPRHRAVNVGLEVLLDEKNRQTTRMSPWRRATTMLHEPVDVVNRNPGKHRLTSKEFQPGKRPSAVWTSVLRERTMPSEADVAAVVVAAETGAVVAAIVVAVVAGDRGKVAQETAVVVVGREKVEAAGDRETAVVIVRACFTEMQRLPRSFSCKTDRRTRYTSVRQALAIWTACDDLFVTSRSQQM